MTAWGGSEWIRTGSRLVWLLMTAAADLMLAVTVRTGCGVSPLALAHLCSGRVAIAIKKLVSGIKNFIAGVTQRSRIDVNLLLRHPVLTPFSGAVSLSQHLFLGAVETAPVSTVVLTVSTLVLTVTHLF